MLNWLYLFRSRGGLSPKLSLWRDVRPEGVYGCVHARETPFGERAKTKLYSFGQSR